MVVSRRRLLRFDIQGDFIVFDILISSVRPYAEEKHQSQKSCNDHEREKSSHYTRKPAASTRLKRILSLFVCKLEGFVKSHSGIFTTLKTILNFVSKFQEIILSDDRIRIIALGRFPFKMRNIIRVFLHEFKIRHRNAVYDNEMSLILEIGRVHVIGIRLQIFVIALPLLMIGRIDDRTDAGKLLILAKSPGQCIIIGDNVYGIINGWCIQIVCLQFSGQVPENSHARAAQKDGGENGHKDDRP